MPINHSQRDQQNFTPKENLVVKTIAFKQESNVQWHYISQEGKKIALKNMKKYIITKQNILVHW